MRARILFLAMLGVCILANNAYAGRPNLKIRNGCNKNVYMKIKAGTVKKENKDAEVNKRIENWSTYQ